jgi:hypothetical protein
MRDELFGPEREDVAMEIPAARGRFTDHIVSM